MWTPPLSSSVRTKSSMCPGWGPFRAGRRRRRFRAPSSTAAPSPDPLPKDLLAHEPVGLVDGLAVSPLIDHGAEGVGDVLVEGARLALVDERPVVLDHAVSQLVRADRESTG